MALVLACARRVVRYARETRGGHVAARRPGPAAALRADARAGRLRQHRPRARAEGARVRHARARLDAAARGRRGGRRRGGARPRAAARRVGLRLAARAGHARDDGPDRRARAARDEADRVPREHVARRARRRGRARARAPRRAGSRARRSTCCARSRRPPTIRCSRSTTRSSRRTRPSTPTRAIVELQTKAATNVANVLTGALPATVVNPGVRELAAYRAGL